MNGCASTFRILGRVALLLLISVALTGPVFAAADVADRDPQVRAAREKVEVARLRRKELGTKSSGLALDAAYAEYNRAVDARVKALATRINDIDARVSRMDSRSPLAAKLAGTDVARAAALPADLEKENGELLAEYRVLAKRPMTANAAFLLEVEPNNTAATAMPLALFTGGYFLFGTITAGDVDYYSFPAPAGSRVWIQTDTGGTQSGGANSRDTVIDLIGPDGTTVLENDDDDGTGNGLDGTVETGFASAIAAHPITTAGTYYVRVRAFSATGIIDPYFLAVLVTTDYPHGHDEAEPNDTPAQAQAIIASQASSLGVRNGAIGAPGDVDYYALNIKAGNAVFVSASGDPERDSVATDLVLDLFDTDGTTPLLHVDSSNTSNIPAESFDYQFSTSGTYYVRVKHANPATGDGTMTYSIAAVIMSTDPPCPTPIISAQLGSDTPDYPSFHGQQTGRVSRLGAPSTCPNAKAYPGFGAATGLRAYDEYLFPNTTGASACVSIDYGGEDCTGTNFIFFVAYLDSFNPADVSQNYLGDAASSDPTGLFSVTVPAGHSLVLVVSEVTPGTGCGHYHFSVAGTGATCLKPIRLDVDAQTTGTTVSNHNGVLEPGERVMVSPNYQNTLRPPVFIENFDSTAVGSLPVGWSAVTSGAGAVFTTVNTGSESLPNSAFIDDPGSVTDKNLSSPPIFVYSDGQAPALLTFFHHYQLENDFDGGVLEISINGGGFQDILTAGGVFVANGYNRTLAASGNPLSGRQAWSGDSGGFLKTVVQLPLSANNKNVTLMWRMGSDSSVAATGWHVDTILIGSSREIIGLSGMASSLAGPPGGVYSLNDSTSVLNFIVGGQIGDCFDLTGNCYEVTVSGTRPGVHWDANFTEQMSLAAAAPKNWKLHIGNSFTDVPVAPGQYRFIENVLHNGVTTGCGATTFCPTSSVTRQQMAVFMLVAREGPGYTPPPCVTPLFSDVPCSSGFAKWINELSNRGVTSGCGVGTFCPTDPVTRQQMAVFLLVTREGVGYTPPPCTTPTFSDVPCANGFSKWIEELVRRGVTAGCGPGIFCPTTAVTRGQMAVFLVTAFGLELYGP